jgi:putative tricarboxylic transport membrane protein
MLDIFIPFILGVAMGLAAGLIPSVSPGRALILSSAFVMVFDPLQLAVLYISLLTVSQFVDAIPSIYLGIPGATSSVPAATESQGLQQKNLCQDAIKFCAISRLVGTILAVVLLTPVMLAAINTVWIYSVKTISVVLALALLGVAMTGRDHWSSTVIMMLAGAMLSAVGFNPVLNTEILTFGQDWLFSGLPLVSVVLGLYVTPKIWQYMIPQDAFPERQPAQTMITQWWQYWPTTVRSALVGMGTGLIPGASYILSSTVCYNLEKKTRMRLGHYSPGDVHSVVASETGNTAGAFASLIPFFLFGIPITLSESIVYDMMLSQGADFSHAYFITNHWLTLSLCFAAASLLGFVLCWPLARPLLYLLMLTPNSWLQWALMTTVVVSVAVVGWANNAIMFYLGCWAVFAILGYLIRRKDCLPLIFVFILFPYIEKNVTTLLQLYF